MSDLDHTFKVFFVDDEPDICQVVGQMLEELHCTVTTFTRAEECLSAIQDRKCDLLITDLNMPGMTGLELLKFVKKILPSIPVLMVTGYGEISIAVQAMKEGACDFVEKPLDSERFISAIRTLLEKISANVSIDGKSLTKAEKRILQLIADGKSNKEMANLLSCSIRTIENHRYRVMRKMNIDSTAGLVKAAINLGLTN